MDGRMLHTDSPPLHSVAAYGGLPQRHADAMNPSYRTLGRAARMAVAALASCTLAEHSHAHAMHDPFADA